MRRTLDNLLVGFSWLVSFNVLIMIGILIGYLLIRGGATFNTAFFFGDTPWMEAILGTRRVFDGTWPALAGTLALVLLASIMAIPVGIASGIYLSEYASRRWRLYFGLAVDMLTGIPSIVMGLFGFALILFFRKTLFPEANTTLFLAAFCIALLVLPYLIRATQNSLQGLPQRIRLLGPSLGLTRGQELAHILLPSSSRGILSGVILAIGRAAEDTAVIMLTGVVANVGLPQGLSAKFEALPFKIFVIASEYRNVSELNQGYGCALVLLLATGILFLCACWLQHNLEKQWTR